MQAFLVPRHICTTLPRMSTCPVPQKIIVIVDSSETFAQDVVQANRNFVTELLAGLPIPPVQVALVRLRDSVQVVSPFQENRSDLVTSLDASEHDAVTAVTTPSNIDTSMKLVLALQTAVDILNSNSVGGATTTQTVLIVTGGTLPGSASAQSWPQADAMKSAGTRLAIAWAHDGIGKSSDSVLNHIASEPVEKNVFYVRTGQTGNTVASHAAETLLAPCPCIAGLNATAFAPDGSSVGVVSGVLLKHGAFEEQGCRTYFPHLAGKVTLTCDNGALRVAMGCLDTCPAGSSGKIYDGEGDAHTVTSSSHLAIGESEVLDCDVALPGTTGEVRLSCENHEIVTMHNCARRCVGGTKVSVGKAQKSLELPEAGLNHGVWMEQSCGPDFGGSVGILGILCVDGHVSSFGECADPAPCPLSATVSSPQRSASDRTSAAPATPSGQNCDTEEEDSALVGLLVGCCCLVILILLGFCIFSYVRRRKRKPVLPDLPDLKRAHEIYTQTACDVTSDARTQTASIITKGVVTQTVPQVYAELVRGDQCPVDLICIVDSSMSVGHEDFQKSADFLLHLVQELEMPTVQAGVIQFNDTFKVVSQLTGRSDELCAAIRDMSFIPGETKLAPPLMQAGRMLKVAHRGGIEDDDRRVRKKVVVVVTDGDPNDYPETEREADALRDSGVLIVMVQVGEQVRPQVAHRLASSPAETYVFHLQSYNALLDASADVLRTVLDVSLLVRRAKCMVNVSNYQEVADLSTIIGHEVMIPGWESRGPESWVWAPRAGKCLLDPQIVPWESTGACNHLELEETTEPPEPFLLHAGIQTDPPPEPLGPILMHAGIQTDALPSPPKPPRPTPVATQTTPDPLRPVATQTDALVKVCLEPWRNAPLDLVICVDSSASFCLARRPQGSIPRGEGMEEQGVFFTSGTFDRAKDFVDQLVGRVDMPEVRLALVRFEDEEDVICAFTDDREAFRKRLQAMVPSAGETRFAPAFRRASELLWPDADLASDGNRVSKTDVGKAVLVITDGDPNDMPEAMQAAAALTNQGSQLIFVCIANHGHENSLQRLASALPRPSPSSFDIGGPYSQEAHSAQGVFRVANDDAETLSSLVPKVLQQLIVSTCRVVQGRLAMPLWPYEVLDEDQMRSISGPQLQMPEPPHQYIDQRKLLWDPARMTEPQTQELTKIPPTRTPRKNVSRATSPAPPGCLKADLPPQLEEMRPTSEEQRLKLQVDELQAALAKARANSNAQAASELVETKLQDALTRARAAEKEVGVLRTELQEKRTSAERQLKSKVEELQTALANASASSAAQQAAEAELQDALRREEVAEKEIGTLRAELREKRSHIERLLNEACRAPDSIRRTDQANVEAAARDATRRAEIAEMESADLKRCIRNLEAELHARHEVPHISSPLQGRARAAEGMAGALMQMLTRSVEETEVASREAARGCTAGGDGTASGHGSRRGSPLRDSNMDSSVAYRKKSLEKAASLTINSRVYENIQFIKAMLEERHGDLSSAFQYIDDNNSKHVTATELIKGLSELGVSRIVCESVFRKLITLSHCEVRGALNLQDWLGSFEKAVEHLNLGSKMGFEEDPEVSTLTHGSASAMIGDTGSLPGL